MKLVKTKIMMYTIEYNVAIPVSESLPKLLEMSSGMSSSCPHDKNWQNMTTILEPMEVPIPLSYAMISMIITMAVYGIQIETDCYHD